eukprot:s5106_g3.t1
MLCWVWRARELWQEISVSNSSTLCYTFTGENPSDIMEYMISKAGRPLVDTSSSAWQYRFHRFRQLRRVPFDTFKNRRGQRRCVLAYKHMPIHKQDRARKAIFCKGRLRFADADGSALRRSAL